MIEIGKKPDINKIKAELKSGLRKMATRLIQDTGKKTTWIHKVESVMDKTLAIRRL